MIHFDHHQAFDRLLDYYYDECPGRIMPLLLLYLMQEGNTEVYIEERISEPLDWKENPESKYIGGVPEFANGETWELNIKNGVVVGGKVE